MLIRKATSSARFARSMPSGADKCCFKSTFGIPMLEYETTRRVNASIVQSIFDEIGEIDRDWWHGALGLDVSEEGRPSILSGRTPLFHQRAIPDGDDLFMAFADAVFIL